MFVEGKDFQIIGLFAESGWTILTVGRYEDTFHRVGGTWKFHRRAGGFVG